MECTSSSRYITINFQVPASLTSCFPSVGRLTDSLTIDLANTVRRSIESRFAFIVERACGGCLSFSETAKWRSVICTSDCR
jgi:hypothetical protein